MDRERFYLRQELLQPGTTAERIQEIREAISALDEQRALTWTNQASSQGAPMTSSTAFTRKVARRTWLESSGRVVLDRDWSCTDGVLSFAGTDGDTFVVYAVDDARPGGPPPHGGETTTSSGGVAEIDEAHRRRLRRMGLQWMNTHGKLYSQLRVDLITVTKLPLGQSNIEYVKGAG